MSSIAPDAAVEHALKSEYTPLALDAPLRRAGFNKAISWIFVASGVILMLCAVASGVSGDGGGVVVITAMCAVFGIVLCAFGVTLGRSSLTISSDGEVVVRGLRTKKLSIGEIARFEVGILPWSGSHRGPAPMAVLQSGRKIPVRALNHSPLSFAGQFDRDIVAAICVRLNELIERSRAATAPPPGASRRAKCEESV